MPVSHRQTESGKTYIQMDDRTKRIIEGLYFAEGMTSKEIAPHVQWPWQSVSAHVKVMQDRIKGHRATAKTIIEGADPVLREFFKEKGIVRIEEIAKTDSPIVKILQPAVSPETFERSELGTMGVIMDDNKVIDDTAKNPAVEAPRAPLCGEVVRVILQGLLSNKGVSIDSMSMDNTGEIRLRLKQA